MTLYPHDSRRPKTVRQKKVLVKWFPGQVVQNLVGTKLGDRRVARLGSAHVEGETFRCRCTMAKTEVTRRLPKQVVRYELNVRHETERGIQDTSSRNVGLVAEAKTGTVG